MRMRLVIAALLCSQLSGCFFFMVHTKREEAAPRPYQGPALTRENLTACRDWDRAERKGAFEDGQQAKKVMVQLSLNEADCRRLIAEADR